MVIDFDFILLTGKPGDSYLDKAETSTSAVVGGLRGILVSWVAVLRGRSSLPLIFA